MKFVSLWCHCALMFLVLTLPRLVSTQTCANNKVFTTCALACPLTCDNYQNPPTCKKPCVVDCECQFGMVQLEDGCVAPSDCPSTSCTKGKIYTTCGTACPLTCGNYQNPPGPCTAQCIFGCVCPTGMVEYKDECVVPSDCPGSTNLVTIKMEIPNCPSGMEYRKCGPICRQTCLPFFIPCFSLRCTPGCFCPEGLLEHVGKCVSKCPDAKRTTTYLFGSQGIPKDGINGATPVSGLVWLITTMIFINFVTQFGVSTSDNL